MFTPPSPRPAVSSRQGAGAVGHGHLQDGDARRAPEASRPGAAAPRFAAANGLLDVAAPRTASRGAPSRGRRTRSMRRRDRVAVREQDVAPQRGVRGRETREVAEPARGQQEDVGLVGLLRGRQAPSAPWRPPAADGSRTPRAGRGVPASIRTGRPPIRSTHASSRSTASGSAPRGRVSGPRRCRRGPRPRRARGPSARSPHRVAADEPRGGRRPARRSTSRTTCPLMLPASVTTALGRRRRARARQSPRSTGWACTRRRSSASRRHPRG